MKRIKFFKVLSVASLLLMAVMIASQVNSASAPLSGDELNNLVGGELTTGCAVGVGISAGLGITGTIALVVPGAQAVGVGLRVTGILVGAVTSALCG